MKYIKTRDALQAFYYLIAVDGSVDVHHVF